MTHSKRAEPFNLSKKNYDPMRLDDGDTSTEIRGYVEDSLTHNRLNNVSVTFLRNGKPLKFTRTKEDGTFVLSISDELHIVDGNYYTSLYRRNSKSDNLGASFYISKGFYDLHLKTRMEGTYNYDKGTQYTSGNAICYKSQTYELKPSIDFSPSWCAFCYEGEFTFYNSKRQNSAVSSLFNWKQCLSATATISHVDLTLSMVHYRNELQEGNHLNCLLGDATAVWRMKKLRLSVELRNIFNKKNYIETTYSGVSTLTDSYQLRPRELMITAQYSF